ncbi:2-iminobutanoate/2-iminopropanoate deaminase [Pedobacter sp. UYP30]|uniref:RidA family protein n=1 Tax=Pedobacter sp. UYP30 TaxID=1756400 RepID=UPI0033977422
MENLSKDNNSIITFQNATTVLKPTGYSQSVEIDFGNCKMIIISGQLALDIEGKIVGKDNLEKQTEQVFLNIKNIIEDLGGTMDNIVKTGIFMTDISQLPTLREIRNKFINPKNPPTSTLLQVSKLFTGDFLIEIEATAIIKK